jgi:hypothetical protein
MGRTFNAKKTLAMAEAGQLSVDELRQAVKDARNFGNQSAALALQAKLEQRTGLRLKPTTKANSLTNAWLAAGVKSVRNIQYSWSAIAEDGVPVFTVWQQYLSAKEWQLSDLAWLVDAQGYVDRKQHALVALSKGGKARAFAIRGDRRGSELGLNEKSQIKFASSEPFEVCVEQRDTDLWLVWK